ncbi:vacuolar ATP synthase subunit S1-domain-containing protein [Collybia nuda]|uniref:Protein BIG1 n=1 Tax=Collybia nuda TaxID=64659 RepID=A0A9P5XWD9_9AGAR|nr:vacuolar ATP synthase subunit S1-domain-containing protein [Collybia nuda]
MAGRLVIAAALCPLAFAFSNTVPLLAWSSSTSNTLDRLPSKTDHTVPLIERILYNVDVCDHDAVVIVEHPGLHASDLRSLAHTSKIGRIFAASPSARQFQYLPADASYDLAPVAESVSMRCGSRLLDLTNGDKEPFSDGLKYVINMDLPSLEASGGSRKDEMSTHDTFLADELEFLATRFPNHLIIYTGSSPSAIHKRQSPPLAPVRPALVSINAPVNTTLPEGGILKRYQLLTPGLITGLLVTIFILLPIVMLGFSALASIQSPLRVEPPKGYSASERKTQ